MMRIILFWIDICLLRAAPQDLPASRVLPVLALACYVLISFLVSLSFYTKVAAFQVAVTDLVLLLALVPGLLYLQGKTARINQTLSALAGCGCLLGLVALPLVQSLGPDVPVAEVPLLVSVFWLCLFVWNLLVVAHIMRHALSSSLAVGIGVAVMYALINIQIIGALFPAQAG